MLAAGLSGGAALSLVGASRDVGRDGLLVGLLGCVAQGISRVVPESLGSRPERDRCQGKRQMGTSRLAAVTFVTVVVRLRSLICASSAFPRANRRGVLHAHRG